LSARAHKGAPRTIKLPSRRVQRSRMLYLLGEGAIFVPAESGVPGEGRGWHPGGPILHPHYTNPARRGSPRVIRKISRSLLARGSVGARGATPRATRPHLPACPEPVEKVPKWQTPRASSCISQACGGAGFATFVANPALWQTPDPEIVAFPFS